MESLWTSIGFPNQKPCFILFCEDRNFLQFASACRIALLLGPSFTWHSRYQEWFWCKPLDLLRVFSSFWKFLVQIQIYKFRVFSIFKLLQTYTKLSWQGSWWMLPTARRHESNKLKQRTLKKEFPKQVWLWGMSFACRSLSPLTQLHLSPHLDQKGSRWLDLK